MSAEAIVCPRCQELNAGGRRHCWVCHTPLWTVAPTPAPATVVSASLEFLGLAIGLVVKLVVSILVLIAILFALLFVTCFGVAFLGGLK